MSAMAGALGIELEKVNHYRLGEGLRSPTIYDILRARRLLYIAVVLGTLVFMFGSFYVYSR